MSHIAIVGSVYLRSEVERLERLGYAELPVVHFARAVLGTGDPALDCAVCQDVLPEHIEAELNNRPYQQWRAVRRHLDLCATCAADYLDLLEIALAAECGPLPRPDLAMDLSFLGQPD